LAYVLNSGIVGHFVFEQLDQDRILFKGLSFEMFLAKMQSNDFYSASFERYLQQNGLDIKLGNDKTLVKKYLTAELARQLFGDKQYYKVMLKDDAMLKAILK
jgi:carboxyl-terminal processing protease